MKKTKPNGMSKEEYRQISLYQPLVEACINGSGIAPFLVKVFPATNVQSPRDQFIEFIKDQWVEFGKVATDELSTDTFPPDDSREYAMFKDYIAGVAYIKGGELRDSMLCDLLSEYITNGKLLPEWWTKTEFMEFVKNHIKKFMQDNTVECKGRSCNYVFELIGVIDPDELGDKCKLYREWLGLLSSAWITADDLQKGK